MTGPDPRRAAALAAFRAAPGSDEDRLMAALDAYGQPTPDGAAITREAAENAARELARMSKHNKFTASTGPDDAALVYEPSSGKYVAEAGWRALLAYDVYVEVAYASALRNNPGIAPNILYLLGQHKATLLAWITQQEADTDD